MESFKRNIGFSTGSLSFGNFRSALSMLEGKRTNAVELSALREWELLELVDSLNELILDNFQYVSFHAPSKLMNFSEEDLVDILKKISDEKQFPIIVHPDMIVNYNIWEKLGSFLCIENMDKRKPIGRSWKDLKEIFARLPKASFCLDLAHARQVDPTMAECFEMLKRYSTRLKQLHISDVTTDSMHVPLNLEAIRAYRKIANLISHEIPIIIESPVEENKIQTEVASVISIFSNEEVEISNEENVISSAYLH